MGINWTTVLVALIAAIPGILTVLIANSNRRALKTQNGDSIGHVVERTHDLAAVSSLAISGVTAAQPMEDSARRLNADEHAPVKVNGDVLPDAGPHAGPQQ